MARLQDFPSVTPTSSDKLLVVQSQSQGLVPYGSKLDSANPTGTGSLSLNRKANTTIGYNSTTEGSNCEASGGRSHAEGEMTVASGNDSHAEGYQSTASNTATHAEGSGTTASGNRAHAEGISTTASGAYSHSEGRLTTASGESSHAEGDTTTASGNRAHAEGNSTTASGYYSHAEGAYTVANHRSQHVFGEFNVADGAESPTTKGAYIEIVGKGSNDANRSNARTLDWSGNEVLAGGLKINGNQDVQGMATLESVSANSEKTYTIPTSIYSDSGIYILAIGNTAGAGVVYLLKIAGASSRSYLVALATTSYFTVESISNNQFKVTAGGAAGTPCLTRIA